MNLSDRACSSRINLGFTNTLHHVVDCMLVHTDGRQSCSRSSDGSALYGDICRQHGRAAQERAVPTARRCAAVTGGCRWPELADTGERDPGMRRVWYTRSMRMSHASPALIPTTEAQLSPAICGYICPHVNGCTTPGDVDHPPCLSAHTRPPSCTPCLSCASCMIRQAGTPVRQ